MAKTGWSRTGLIYRLNKLLNPNHDWFDYGWSEMGEPKGLFGIGDAGSLNGLTGLSDKGFLGLPTGSLDGLINSLIAHYTRNTLTGAENEQNAFNAAEAQKSRDFTEYMARNKYSMETQSMADAGVNPAMVYGGGNLVPTAANGATGQGSAAAGGDIFAAIATIARMPAEIEKLRNEGIAAIENAESNRINAEANRQNANSNAQNADSQARQAAVAERQAAVAEAEVDIKRTLADNDTRATDAQVGKMAADEAYVRAMIDWLPTEIEIKRTHASAAQTAAYAAVQQAKAAQQNADNNSKLTDSQVLLNGILRQKEATYVAYLPAELSAKIDEMKARGYYFDQQGKLVDKEGKLVDAKIAREYVGLACDVARTTCQVAGTIATGGAGGVLVKGEPSGPRPASVPQYSDYSQGTYGTYGD